MGYLDRLAHAFWITAPFWLRDTRLGRWLLPYAGRHGYPKEGKSHE